MNKPLSIGIVGSGFIAGVHASSLKKIADVTITAVVDTDVVRAAEFAKKHGIAAHYASFQAMLDAHRFDAIYFCIPPFAHQGEVEQAAARGIHCFLEKPIAMDSVKATAMVDAIEKAGVISQVGFHYRFRKSVRALKRLIDSGEAGKVSLFSGRYWTNMDGALWWRKQDMSGGQIYEQVIHIYDLARFFMGEIKSVHGLMRNVCHQGRADYTIEDTSIGTLAFKNGSVGVITGSNCAIPVHFIGDFKVVCEKVTLDYQCTGQHWVTPDSARLYSTSGAVESVVEDEDPYLLESIEFISAIQEGRAASTPARVGLEAILLVEALIADAANHQ
ncbi:MAG: Gfo/Idh/MocA family oxidoreductase [Verrucomicrobiota bacterium]|nr:Gfo/Idh/MocA family oxidoreductase [Verrucomicrobiota bacterium]